MGADIRGLRPFAVEEVLTLTSKKKREVVFFVFIAVVLFFVFKTRSTWIQIAGVLGLAVLFALILAPVCTQLERYGISQGGAVLLSVFLFLTLFFVFMFSFFPYLISQAVGLAKRISPTITLMMTEGEQLFRIWGGASFPSINISQMIAAAIAPLTAEIAKGGVAVVSSIGKLAMSVVFAYYLLTVRHEAGKHMILLIPTAYRRTVLSAVKGSKNAVLGYLSGIIKTGIFVSAATFIGLVLLGVREAMILSLFMGLLEGFPYIGPVLGSVPILLSVIPMGLGKTVAALTMIFIIQQIEGGIIGPYFTASSTSIHPLAAIISVYIGGSLFGLVGILFAVPLVVIVRSVFWSLRSASILLEP